MIYLASRSPRRLALLEQIGITDVRLLLDEDEARARTGELLDSLVGAAKDREIAVERESDAGVDVLTVTVRTRLPLVGGLGPRWLTVRGRSLVEGP